MIRIALCDINKEEGRHLRNIINSFADEDGMNNIEVRLTSSCEDFLSVMERVQPNFFDLGIIRIIDPDNTIAQRMPGFLEQVGKASPRTKIVLLSNEAEHALYAYDANALYLQLPSDRKNFIRAIGEPLRQMVLDYKSSFAVKSGKTVVNMDINDITFIETNKKGPIIHLPGNRSVTARGTLQSLYERLCAVDDRFVRAGGSFIINLDNVRTVGDSSVIFADGDAIILPVRARKPIKEALRAYQMRA